MIKQNDTRVRRRILLAGFYKDQNFFLSFVSASQTNQKDSFFLEMRKNEIEIPYMGFYQQISVGDKTKK